MASTSRRTILSSWWASGTKMGVFGGNRLEFSCFSGLSEFANIFHLESWPIGKCPYWGGKILFRVFSKHVPCFPWNKLSELVFIL
jgi:hypothetical protein